MGALTWTPEQDAMIRRLADDGCTAADVWKALVDAGFDCTRNSVIGRASRMKPRVEWLAERGKDKRPRRSRRKALVPKEIASIPFEQPAVEPEYRCPDPLLITIFGLNGVNCPWPEVSTHDDDHAPYLYCGANKLFEDDYCPYHNSVARRRRPRNERVPKG